MLPLKDQRSLFHELIGIIESSQYTPIIDRTYPLSEVPLAHSYVDTGRKKGDVVITMN
jgi:NADPH:quinone reductase-like Zn-dependent oxidoreductase